MSDIEQEREWFEQWATKPPHHFDIRRTSTAGERDNYASLSTEFAWRGWKASAEKERT